MELWPGSQPETQATTVCPATKIIMLTGSEDEEHLLAALRVGARAYALKGVSAREQVTIVRSVAEGDVYVTPAMANSLLFDKNQNLHVLCLISGITLPAPFLC